MTSEAEQSIRYRLQRAREALVEADAMADIGHWEACVNRLYYACFYAATALLLRNGQSASKHTGVQSILNRDFVRTGAVPPELGRLYNRLFENRHEADYADFVAFEESDVRPWMEGARQFVAHVEGLLSTDGEGTSA